MLAKICLFQKVRKWIYNHYDSPNRAAIKFIRKWSARNVFYHEKKKIITDRAKEVSGHAPGSQEFFGALQDATTHFWRELSEEDIDIYEGTAAEWSYIAPPRHIQARQMIPHIFMNVPTHPTSQNGVFSNPRPHSARLSNPAL
jgi:hypothetical protein